MLNDKQRSDLEQAIAGMREVFPSSWRQLYEGCIEEGFTEKQSMDLVKTYILSQNPFGIRPCDGSATDI